MNILEIDRNGRSKRLMSRNRRVQRNYPSSRERMRENQFLEENDFSNDSDVFLVLIIKETASNYNWVQCERCQKWRKLGSKITVELLPEV